MQQVEVNGKIVRFRTSPYNARNSLATYKRKILDALNKIGIENQYIDIQFGGGTGYRNDAWAEVIWYVNGIEHQYKCDSQTRDVDNVAAIAQMIEQDSKAIRRGMKTFGQVMNQFRLEYIPMGERTLSPREILGVEADCKDWDYIIFKYKRKAKELHPDNKESGDADKFKQLQEAMEELKSEFGKTKSP